MDFCWICTPKQDPLVADFPKTVGESGHFQWHIDAAPRDGFARVEIIHRDVMFVCLGPSRNFQAVYAKRGFHQHPDAVHFGMQVEEKFVMALRERVEPKFRRVGEVLAVRLQDKTLGVKRFLRMRIPLLRVGSLCLLVYALLIIVTRIGQPAIVIIAIDRDIQGVDVGVGDGNPQFMSRRKVILRIGELNLRQCEPFNVVAGILAVVGDFPLAHHVVEVFQSPCGVIVFHVRLLAGRVEQNTTGVFKRLIRIVNLFQPIKGFPIFGRINRIFGQIVNVRQPKQFKMEFDRLVIFVWRSVEDFIYQIFNHFFVLVEIVKAVLH